MVRVNANPSCRGTPSIGDGTLRLLAEADGALLTVIVARMKVANIGSSWMSQLRLVGFEGVIILDEDDDQWKPW